MSRLWAFTGTSSSKSWQPTSLQPNIQCERDYSVVSWLCHVCGRSQGPPLVGLDSRPVYTIINSIRHMYGSNNKLYRTIIRVAQFSRWDRRQKEKSEIGQFQFKKYVTWSSKTLHEWVIGEQSSHYSNFGSTNRRCLSKVISEDLQMKNHIIFYYKMMLFYIGKWRNFT